MACRRIPTPTGPRIQLLPNLLEILTSNLRRICRTTTRMPRTRRPLTLLRSPNTIPGRTGQRLRRLASRTPTAFTRSATT